MARLSNKPAQGHFGSPFDCADCGEDHDLHIQRGEADMMRLGFDNIMEFSAGDDAARYFIESEKPLILTHIDFCDGYRALPATIRGTTMHEVTGMRAFNRILGKMFIYRGTRIDMKPQDGGWVYHLGGNAYDLGPEHGPFADSKAVAIAAMEHVDKEV